MFLYSLFYVFLDCDLLVKNYDIFCTQTRNGLKETINLLGNMQDCFWVELSVIMGGVMVNIARILQYMVAPAIIYHTLVPFIVSYKIAINL